MLKRLAVWGRPAGSQERTEGFCAGGEKLLDRYDIQLKLGGPQVSKFVLRFLTLALALVLCAGTALAAAEGNAHNFGDKARTAANQLEGKIYYLAEGTEALPDFAKFKPIEGSIYTDALNIEPRSFEEGFPGIADRIEWFALAYTGKFGVKRAGQYTFALLSDDGSRLYIDGKLVVDNDGVHGPGQAEGSVALKPGVHTIRVEYFQGPRYDIALQLFVTPPGGEQRVFSTADFPLPQ